MWVSRVTGGLATPEVWDRPGTCAPIPGPWSGLGTSHTSPFSALSSQGRSRKPAQGGRGLSHRLPLPAAGAPRTNRPPGDLLHGASLPTLSGS